MLTNITRPLKIRRLVLTYSFMIFVLAFIQVHPRLWQNLTSPDFLLIFPLVIGLIRGGYEGLAVGLAAGFLRDYLAGRLYGPGMLEGMLIALIASMFQTESNQTMWRRLFVLTFSCSISHQFLMTILAYFFPISRMLSLNMKALMRNFTSKLLQQTLLDVLASVLILLFLWLLLYQKQKTSRTKSKLSYR